MEQIKSLFKHRSNGRVYDEVVPGSEWVLDGEGIATPKIDRLCCKVREEKILSEISPIRLHLSYTGIEKWLTIHNQIEGIVWHHRDGRMVKVTRHDFELEWPIRPYKGEKPKRRNQGEKVRNYHQWQRCIKLQCRCLLNLKIHGFSLERLNRIEIELKRLPMVDQSYFYW